MVRLIMLALLLCARPECGHLEDARPWCSTCQKHIDNTTDPDHQHHRN